MEWRRSTGWGNIFMIPLGTGQNSWLTQAETIDRRVETFFENNLGGGHFFRTKIRGRTIFFETIRGAKTFYRKIRGVKTFFPCKIWKSKISFFPRSHFWRSKWSMLVQVTRCVHWRMIHTINIEWFSWFCVGLFCGRRKKGGLRVFFEKNKGRRLFFN